MPGKEQAQRLVRTAVLPGQRDRRHGEAPLAAFDKYLEFGDAAKERREVSARSSIKGRSQDDILPQGQISDD